MLAYAVMIFVTVKCTTHLQWQ